LTVGKHAKLAESEPPAVTTPTWEITHSVETSASPGFAWSYWTDVTNWSDPPAEFSLEGPFAAGSRGTTWLPGHDPLHWIIRDVAAPVRATIEMPLAEGAFLLFAWRFDAAVNARTRLTRRILLVGEKADDFLAQAKAAFSTAPADGMKKLAAAMAEAEESG
jgi:hypothetical protein